MYISNFLLDTPGPIPSVIPDTGTKPLKKKAVRLILLHVHCIIEVIWHNRGYLALTWFNRLHVQG